MVEKESLEFMNDLSNKILTELSGLRNFFKDRAHNGGKSEVHPLDMKLFYLFVQDKSDLTSNSKRKKKSSSQSDHSKHSSDSTVKAEYSITDLIGMTTKELSSKIFTFDKKLAG